MRIPAEAIDAAFLAGLLFGDDRGVISGALPLVTADLGLSTFAAEIITSWVTLGAIGEAATFFLLAGLCVASYIWIHRNVPETRGRTLEEIQELWNPSTTRPPAAPTTDP